MQMAKREIVRALQHAGLPHVAEEAEQSLSDEVDILHLEEFGAR
jgi:hypothetical protein